MTISLVWAINFDVVGRTASCTAENYRSRSLTNGVTQLYTSLQKYTALGWGARAQCLSAVCA